MALHRLLGIEIGVPDPASLDAFYREIGFTGGERSWGAADQPGQISIGEAGYRQLRQMRVACESEQDISTIAKNLDGIGVASTQRDGILRVIDMDRITDDDAWTIREDWPMDDSWSLWGEKVQPEVFFRPHDIDEVIEGWNKAHG